MLAYDWLKPDIANGACTKFTVNRTHLLGDDVGHLDNVVNLVSRHGLISVVLF